MNHIPATMRGTGIGAPVRRVEDMRFLRGQGRYVDDLGGSDAVQLVMLRSPHASARITRLDASKARGMPGVLLVLTPEDIEELGVLRCVTPRLQRNGSPLAQTPVQVLSQVLQSVPVN